MLFYFTGTGNCLSVARTIEERPVSIPQAIHQTPLTFSDEQIGIVAPIYGHEMPTMVHQFLREADFRCNYFYLILTYGNRHGGASELAKQFCDACGISVDYINVLCMVDNWLPSFDMDEQRQIDKQIDVHLSAIKEDIAQHRKMIAAVTEEDRAAHREFLNRMAQMPADAWQHLLTVNDACIGCGICERVCPSASIRVIDHKAVHTPGNCQTCLACIHACPHHAIQLTVPEKNPNARYRNPNVTLADLMEANQQRASEHRS